MSGRQFFWGGTLLKSNGVVYQGQLSADGNRAGRVKAKAGLTARLTSRAGAKAELNDPMAMPRTEFILVRGLFIERPKTTDKSYPGDNRLVRSESSYRRPRSAPRCRLATSRRWKRCQGVGCSPIKVARELGSDRQFGGFLP